MKLQPRAILTALLLTISFAAIAQTIKPDDAQKLEKYKASVREKLAFDYSMPDYNISKIDERVIGSRMAIIIEKVLANFEEHKHSPVELSSPQSSQIEGLDYCTIEKLSFKNVAKKGNEITISFDTTLKPNFKNIKNAQLDFVFVDGASKDKATNDYFIRICRYIR